MPFSSIHPKLDLHEIEPAECSGSYIKLRSGPDNYLLMALNPILEPREPHWNLWDRADQSHPEIVDPLIPAGCECRGWHSSLPDILSQISETLSQSSSGHVPSLRGKFLVVNSEDAGAEGGDKLPTVTLHFDNPDAILDLKSGEELAFQQIATASASAEDCCGLLIPSLISAGGFFLGADFYIRVSHLCTASGLALIFDERSCNPGASGRVWTCENYGLQPAAVIFGMEPGPLGCFVKSNISGDPVSKPASGKQSEIIRRLRDEDYLAQVRKRGEKLLELLQWIEAEFPAYVTCSRTLGLMGAFEVPSSTEREAFLEQLAENQMIVETAGDRSILIRPGLCVTDAELDACADRLHQSLLGSLK